jgi:hypothetical protein
MGKNSSRHDFEREMEIRIRGVEARGEAAILRVNSTLLEIRDRITKLESQVRNIIDETYKR